MSIIAQIRALKPSSGATETANKQRSRATPTLQDIMDIPAAVAGVYELRENEVKTTRSRIYTLNKDNAFGWRWRTMLERGSGRYHTLLVWRIH